MLLKEELLTLLWEHLQHRRGIQWIDIYKLLYQGVYGGEHLLRDAAQAERAFRQEWRLTPPTPDEPLMERISLDGRYVRLNFGRCRFEEIKPEIVWQSFIQSQRSPKHRRDLQEILEAFTELCREGRLPFDYDEVRCELCRLSREGFPPRHHSAAFREANRPAYRVVEKAAFEKIFSRREKAHE